MLPIFCKYSESSESFSRNKSLAISKMAKLEFFFQIFRANIGGLRVFRDALGVANFFRSILHALNCIQAMEYFAI